MTDQLEIPRFSRRKTALKSAGLWLIGDAFGLMLGFYASGTASTVNVLFAQKAVLGANLSPDITANLELIGRFLAYNLWLTLLSTYGLAAFIAALEIPSLVDWLSQNYLGLYAQPDTYVYFGLLEPAANPQTSSDNPLHLAQLKLDLAENQNFVSARWILSAPLTSIPSQKITLKSETVPETVIQTERQILNGLFTPDQWPTGTQLADTFSLSLPDTPPAGTYRISIELCDADQTRCLPVVPEPDDNTLEITPGITSK